MARAWRRAACAVATVGGVGCLRPGSGTWGSAVAAAAAAAFALTWPAGLSGALAQWVLIAGTAMVVVASLVCIPAAIDRYDREDPGQVVIDEVAGVWLAAALVPGHLLLAQPLWAAGCCFLLFRIIDIAKPWPLPGLERLGGAPGVLTDDLAAGAIAGLATGVILA